MIRMLDRFKQSGADLAWFESLPCAITVCDRSYKIVYMNEKSADSEKESGGKELIGKNLMDCHPPKAQAKLREVMASGSPHVYAVKKSGVRKLVYQSQWKRNGRVAGLVEIRIELPKKLTTLVRK